MEIFKRKWSELSGERFDAEYYKDEYYIFNKKIQQSNFKYLNEIVEPIKNGSTPSNGKFENEGIPYFRSQDLNLYDSI
ncbi:MAG: hypothetical protein J1D99_04190, partial [Campylobacter sp.]|nr:hypothetical protein [Campylobacter sp.]